MCKDGPSKCLVKCFSWHQHLPEELRHCTLLQEEDRRKEEREEVPELGCLHSSDWEEVGSKQEFPCGALPSHSMHN